MADRTDAETNLAVAKALRWRVAKNGTWGAAALAFDVCELIQMEDGRLFLSAPGYKFSPREWSPAANEAQGRPLRGRCGLGL